MASAEQLVVGDEWCYRASAGKPLVPVRVEALGTKRPLRVRVFFIDDSFEGQNEWVPAGRLVARWSERETFLEREAQWDSLRTNKRQDDPDLGAVEFVFDLLFTEQEVDLEYRGRHVGLLRIHDRAAASAIGVALPVDPLVREDGIEYFLFKDALDFAKRVTEAKNSIVANAVEAEYRLWQRRAAFGYTNGYGNGGEYTEPSAAQAMLDNWILPRIRIVASWCGVDAITDARLLDEARLSAAIATDVANRAIHALLQLGDRKTARNLHFALYPDTDIKRWRSIVDLKTRDEAKRHAEQLRHWEVLAQERMAKLNDLERRYQRAVDELYS